MILEAELLNNLAVLPIEKRAITNHRVLNEAYDYAKPSSFVRGMRMRRAIGSVLFGRGAFFNIDDV